MYCIEKSEWWTVWALPMSCYPGIENTLEKFITYDEGMAECHKRNQKIAEDRGLMDELMVSGKITYREYYDWGLI